MEKSFIVTAVPTNFSNRYIYANVCVGKSVHEVNRAVAVQLQKKPSVVTEASITMLTA